MASTPATGSVAAVADAVASVMNLIAAHEAELNSPGMVQAAVAEKLQAMKDAANKAVETENTAAVQEGIS